MTASNRGRQFLALMGAFLARVIASTINDSHIASLVKAAEQTPQLLRSREPWMLTRGTNKPRGFGRGGAYGSGGQPGRRGKRQHERGGRRDAIGVTREACGVQCYVPVRRLRDVRREARAKAINARLHQAR